MTSFYLTDRYGNPLGRLGYVFSAKRDRTTNGTDVLDISCRTQCDKGDRIVFIDSAGNPREYIITDLEQTREDSLEFTYHCANSITELALFFIEDRRSRSEDAQQMLSRVLNGTRWHVGTVSTGGADNLSFYHTTAYQAVLDICNLWNLEWETQLTISDDGSHINSRSINLVPHIGSTSPRRFDFGRNLVGLSRSVDSSNVITRLYPYGNSVQETDATGEATGGYSRKIDISSVNGGKTYIEDTAATLLWGVPDASGQIQPAMGMEEYDADDPATLLAMAQADLPNLVQPKISYTATVATLGIEGVDRSGIGVGDDVYVNDTAYPTPIRLQGRVLEIVDDLVDPLSDDTEITLGNLLATYTADTDRLADVVDMLQSNSNIWNDAANTTPSYIDSVIAGLNQQLNQTGGYVYLEPGEGIIVYDKPKDENPTMAIQLGGGYFRIANSKNSDGSWDWRTAGTGAGLVADVLVAGTIVGGSNYWNLETGDLSFTQGSIGRSDGSTFWNLTTGEFKFAPTSTIGDTDTTIGKLVISSSPEYGLSDDVNTVPSSWSESVQWEQNKILWMRYINKYVDGTTSEGQPQILLGPSGSGLVSVRQQYYLSTSNTSQVGGSWEYSQPAWVDKHFYWTRSEFTFADGSISYTDPTLASALTSGNQSTDDLDASLDQLDIFNRLTNNGQTQGLYLSNGLLYVNGSYIKSGTIDANLIKAGIISDKNGLCYWNLITGEMRTTNMVANNIVATGQITSTYNGTSAAIKGGTMVYSNNYGGRFQISNDRMGSGSSWINLIGNGVDNLVLQNETSNYNSTIYVMCGPDFVDSAKLSLLYSQFANLEVDSDNYLLVSDGGVQHYSTGYYTSHVKDNGDNMLFDMGQGSNSPSRIWLGINNSYDPCLKINSNSCQISCNDLNRVDLATSYAALVHGDYHVMVDANGVSQTTRSRSATELQTSLMEQRLMTLADEGVDLSDPSGYSQQPAAIDEIKIDQIHALLRLLADGDTDGAKNLLDNIEANQRIWTQAELDEFDSLSKTDYSSGKADQDRQRYISLTSSTPTDDSASGSSTTQSSN